MQLAGCATGEEEMLYCRTRSGRRRERKAAKGSVGFGLSSVFSVVEGVCWTRNSKSDVLVATIFELYFFRNSRS